MLIPVLILLVCFIAGVMSSARWLPNLAPGSVGGLAFFAVVGLFSAALSVGGLRAYLLITELTNRPGFGGSKAEILADGMQSILFDAGTLFAFAGIVFLLAPGADEADEQQPTSLRGDA